MKDQHTALGRSGNPVSVLIVDDFAAVRVGLRALLSSGSRTNDLYVEVVAEAATASYAVAASAALQPDVVLLDIRLPDGSGIHAIRKILRDSPQTRVIMVTASRDRRDLAAAMQHGARGYITQDDLTEDRLMSAIISVLSGGIVVGSVDRPATRKRPASASVGPVSLSDTEWAVLKFLSRGISNAAIAADLGVEKEWIGRLIGGIATKLGLNSRLQTMVYARDFLLRSTF